MQNYSQRELDMKFQSLETKVETFHTETMEKIAEIETRNHDKQIEILGFLSEIKAQTTKHNGRLSKVERILLIIGCVVGTLFMMNGSALIKFVMSLI